MTGTRRLRPSTGSVPDEPGVYRFRDASGRVIYVGKAKSLRQRLSSYFTDPRLLHPRTAQMVAAAADLDWVVVRNEVEALQLEYSWIKEYDPRFNVKYRDDKSYPYLAVTVDEEFPRALVMRGAKRKGTRYFGPYAHAWAIRETVELLLRVFPMRTCSPGVFRRAQATDRPCLLADIGRCSAPCVGRVGAQEHREIVDDFCAFLAGRHQRFVARLTEEMTAAAADLDFESAARRRDDLAALDKALSRTAVVFNDDTDADVIALVDDDLEGSVQIFHVRAGRVSGQRGFVVEKAADDGLEQLLEAAIVRHYGERLPQVESGGVHEAIPREVLVQVEPTDSDVIERWLSGLRGAKVGIRVPRRGDKKALLDTAVRNAQQALSLHKSRRSGDITSRSQALAELQQALELPEAPLRIECFDVSHLNQEDPVAAMVVFEDALPRKGEYRTYNIRGKARDDTRAIAEAVTRRYRAMAPTADGSQGVAAVGDDGDPLEDAALPAPRLRYRPGLLVVDGAAPQVEAAAQALADLGLTNIPVVGLAKRLEEVWAVDDPEPVILPRTSEGLFLLQRVRDEAHRFAITAQRRRRRPGMRRSVLDDIVGLGPARRRALLKHFGSVTAMREADAEAIAAVSGIGPTLAETIVESLRSEPAKQARAQGADQAKGPRP